MTTRPVWTYALMIAGALATPPVLAQPAGQTQTAEGLRNGRGAPTGRIGAATRMGENTGQDLTLDLVAPLQGTGLAASDGPALFYLMSGTARGRLRLTISQPRQIRPLADLDLARTNGPGTLHRVSLRDHHIRLVPNQVYVWSVSVVLDPNSPSHDIVASATIAYRPADPSYQRAMQLADVRQRPAVAKRAGYWYDAVAAAQDGAVHDGGTALAELFREAQLPPIQVVNAGGTKP
ncbi:MAG: DUF928 domain-containing protein [Acetobacteraceae bacterium]